MKIGNQFQVQFQFWKIQIQFLQTRTGSLTHKSGYPPNNTGKHHLVTENLDIVIFFNPSIWYESNHVEIWLMWNMLDFVQAQSDERSVLAKCHSCGVKGSVQRHPSILKSGK